MPAIYILNKQCVNVCVCGLNTGFLFFSVHSSNDCCSFMRKTSTENWFHGKPLSVATFLPQITQTTQPNDVR